MCHRCLIPSCFASKLPAQRSQHMSMLSQGETVKHETSCSSLLTRQEKSLRAMEIIHSDGLCQCRLNIYDVCESSCEVHMLTHEGQTC